MISFTNRDGVFSLNRATRSVCLVRGFLAHQLGTVLKLLINRRPFFRAAKQQPAEVLAKCDLCYTAPCQNGGLCEALPDRQFRCKCAPGYHGDRCQHKIDACYGNPCKNSGTCKVLEEGRFRYLPARLFSSLSVARRVDFSLARNPVVEFLFDVDISNPVGAEDHPTGLRNYRTEFL